MLAAGLTSVPAAAQGGPGYPAPAAMPPYEIIAIVRSTGFEPLSRPVRHGPTYSLQAADPAGRPVRVVVDARLGRIVGVTPVTHGRFAAPIMEPPYGRPPAGVASVPDGDGYGPVTRTGVLPPGGEGTNGMTLGSRERLPMGPGRVASANTGESQPQAAQPHVTPLPRPRPKLAAADPAPAAAAAPIAATAAGAPVAATPAPAAHKDTVQAKNLVQPAAPTVAPPAAPSASAPVAAPPIAPVVEQHE